MADIGRESRSWYLQEEVNRLYTQIEIFKEIHERLYRVGHCGSVDAFLKCDDEVKRGYFAMMIHESSENKRLRGDLDDLLAFARVIAQSNQPWSAQDLADLIARIEDKNGA
jgi:hypothetical protein